MRRLLVSTLVACGQPPVATPKTCPSRATIAAPEDVRALAECTQLDALTIRTAGELDLTPLAKLATINGDLIVGPSVGLGQLSLPALNVVIGEIRVVSNHDLLGVYLRELGLAKAIAIDNNVSLQTVSLPKLDSIETLHIGSAPALELVDLSRLKTANELAIDEAPELALVEVTAPRARTLRLGNVPKLAPAAVDKLRASPGNHD
jgi:hypothetical protein